MSDFNYLLSYCWSLAISCYSFLYISLSSALLILPPLVSLPPNFSLGSLFKITLLNGFSFGCFFDMSLIGVNPIGVGVQLLFFWITPDWWLCDGSLRPVPIFLVSADSWSFVAFLPLVFRLNGCLLELNCPWLLLVPYCLDIESFKICNLLLGLGTTFAIISSSFLISLESNSKFSCCLLN